MSREKIEQFNQDYTKTYESCDLAEIKDYVDQHFTDNYVASYEQPANGQTAPQVEKMTKEEVLNGMQESIDIAKANNLTPTNCNTKVAINDMRILDNGMALVQMKQVEQMALVNPEGKTIPVAIMSICKHAMTEEDGVVKIAQSLCMMQNNAPTPQGSQTQSLQH